MICYLLASFFLGVVYARYKKRHPQPPRKSLTDETKQLTCLIVGFICLSSFLYFIWWPLMLLLAGIVFWFLGLPKKGVNKWNY